MKKILRISTAAVLLSASTVALAGWTSDIGSVTPYAAQKAEKDWSGMIGLAVLSAPEYWGSEDTEGTGVPVIIVDYKDTAYFKVNRGGVWFWKPNDSFRVGALVKIRPAAWEEDDDSIEDLGPLPAGFDEPDAAAEPGVNFRYTTGELEIEGQATSGEDVNLEFSIGYHLIKSQKLLLTAALGIENLGEDTVKYDWYGDLDSPDADSATNTSIGLRGIYSLNKDWKLFFGAKSTSLADEIDDSPIVEDDKYTVGYFGAAWAF
jgi:outer membrane scaffolding protein for murein synthesis (MipA/OmpV family)